MNLLEYIILVLFIFLCAEVLIFSIFILNKLYEILKENNSLKEKDIKNKKNELMTKISPEAVQESIDKYFEQYINKYIMYNFIAKNSIYIKNDEIEKMVKDVTKAIYIDISELYVFYISIDRSIKNDDDLLKYIHSKVKSMSVDAVSNYNSSMVPSV